VDVGGVLNSICGVVQPNPHPLLAACVNLEFCASICSQMGHGWAGAEVPAGGARQSAPGDALRARTHVASAHSKLMHKVLSSPIACMAVKVMGALMLKAALGHTHLPTMRFATPSFWCLASISDCSAPLCDKVLKDFLLEASE